MQPWNEDAFVNKLFPASSPQQGNHTNLSCATRYVYESNEIRVTRLAAESFLVLVGIVFNVIIGVLNLKQSSFNTAIRVYIRNMAFADAGVLLFGFPFAVAKEQQGTSQWVLGGLACRYLYPVTDTFYTVAAWSLVAIAVERLYIMKASPLRWNGGVYHFKPSGGLRVCLILWVTAFIVVSLPLLFVSHYESMCDRKYCTVRWPSANQHNQTPAKVHAFSLLTVLYIVPLGVVVWSYCKLSFGYRPAVYSREAGPRHRRLQSDNSENTNTSLLSELDEARQQECSQAKRLLTPLVILFLITSLPINMLRVIFIFTPQRVSLEKYLVLYNISIMLNVCNSVVRPFIYCTVSQDIRIACSVLVSKARQRWRYCRGHHDDETTIPLQDEVTMVSIRHPNYKETTL